MDFRNHGLIIKDGRVSLIHAKYLSSYQQILFALLTLWGFQITGAAQEKAYPPPGKLVDGRGWRLHPNCKGKCKGKAATVVLEADSVNFDLIHIDEPINGRCQRDRPADELCGHRFPSLYHGEKGLVAWGFPALSQTGANDLT